MADDQSRKQSYILHSHVPLKELLESMVPNDDYKTCPRKPTCPRQEKQALRHFKPVGNPDVPGGQRYLCMRGPYADPEHEGILFRRATEQESAILRQRRALALKLAGGPIPERARDGYILLDPSSFDLVFVIPEATVVRDIVYEE